MKLPFWRQALERAIADHQVDRESLQLLLAQAEGTAKLLRELLVEERARADRLTDTIVTMKRQGYDVTALPAPLRLPEPELAEEINEAIRSRARIGTPLSRELSDFAAGQLVKPGANVAAIAKRIRAGADLDRLEGMVEDEDE